MIIKRNNILELEKNLNNLKSNKKSNIEKNISNKNSIKELNSEKLELDFKINSIITELSKYEIIKDIVIKSTLNNNLILNSVVDELSKNNQKTKIYK